MTTKPSHASPKSENQEPADGPAVAVPFHILSKWSERADHLSAKLRALAALPFDDLGKEARFGLFLLLNDLADNADVMADTLWYESEKTNAADGNQPS